MDSFTCIPKALIFDVFGTCVDWRSTVTEFLYDSAQQKLLSSRQENPEFGAQKASSMTMTDWAEFAQAWRSRYGTFVRTVAGHHDVTWKSIDQHHHESLIELLGAWDLNGFWTEAEVRGISLVWHRLKPWLDSSAGLQRLKQTFITCTLTNGNLSLLHDLVGFANLDFQYLFSAEMFGTYKPAPATYLGAVEKLGLAPYECAMVAAHLHDLAAAKSCGLSTIYVERPLEEDMSQETDPRGGAEFVDLWIAASQDGFNTLADILHPIEA